MGDWQIVLWSVDPKDYAANSPLEILAHLQQSQLTERDIVLLHDTAKATVLALDTFFSAPPEGGRR